MFLGVSYGIDLGRGCKEFVNVVGLVLDFGIYIMFLLI